MNARQMYITVAQVQEIVVDFYALQCGNILATRRLEILHLSDLGPAQQVLAAIQFLSQILPLLADIFIVMVLCRIASEISLWKRCGEKQGPSGGAQVT